MPTASVPRASFPTLYEAGCRNFFVATQTEAQTAIALAPGATIYVLDGIMPGCAREIAALGVRPVMASLEEARAWAALATSDTRTPPAALHVDTGLNRLGMSEADFAIARRRRASCSAGSTSP